MRGGGGQNRDREGQNCLERRGAGWGQAVGGDRSIAQILHSIFAGYLHFPQTSTSEIACADLSRPIVGQEAFTGVREFNFLSPTEASDLPPPAEYSASILYVTLAAWDGEDKIGLKYMCYQKTSLG